MEDYKYSTIEEIIKKNSHLKNEELAKKIGKSISWVKAFKAFMRAEDKEKYKDTKNPIYKAIYNIWIKDPKAQKKEEEKNLIKKLQQKLEECEDLLEDYENDFFECSDKYKELKEKYDYLLKNLEKEKEKIETKLKEKYSHLVEEWVEAKHQLEQEKLEYYGMKNEYYQDYRKLTLTIKVLTIISGIEFIICLFKFTH